MSEPIFRLPPYFPSVSVRKMARPVNYGIELIGCPAQWAITRGKGQRVAVLDTGRPAHRDIPNVVAALNFSNSDTADAVEGHSVHVCGIIAARAFDAATGLTGVAPEAEIVIGKVLGDDGSGQASWIVKAIQWAFEEEGCRIFNLSLGAPPEAEASFKSVRLAMEKYARPSTGRGAIFICAAGNEYGPLGVPGRWDCCLAVGAVDKNRVRADFSDFGPELDFAAPGVDIWSTWLANRYLSSDGTSMAAPFIAGMAALICSEHDDGAHHNTPVAGVWDLKAHLDMIAVDLGAPGHDVEYGEGLPVFVTSIVPPPPVPAPTPEPLPVPDPIPAPLPPPPAPKPKPVPPKPPVKRSLWERFMDWLWGGRP